MTRDASANVIDGQPRQSARYDRNLRAALAESRQRYKDLVEISSDFAWETDADGVFVFVSPRGALGFAPDELIGRSAASFLDRSDHDDGTPPFVARQRVVGSELWFRRADGGRALLDCTSLPRFDASGGFQGCRGLCRDITDARAREDALAQTRTRERLFTYVMKAIWDEPDHRAVLPAAANAVQRALSADDVWIAQVNAGDQGPVVVANAGNGSAPDAAVLAEDVDAPGCREAQDGERMVLAAPTRYRRGAAGVLAVARHRHGLAWEEDDRTLLADLAGQVGIAMDHVAQVEALERLSRVDGLTGLLVRRAFEAELVLRLDAGSGALVYIDLDNFKPVNDRHGHAAGDKVLTEVARILEANAGEGDLVARLGGDEFALWIDGADASEAQGCAAMLQAAVTGLATYSAGRDRPLGFSIGIALYDRDSRETLDGLIARADAVMYAVKHDGKGGVRLAESPSGLDA